MNTYWKASYILVILLLLLGTYYAVLSYGVKNVILLFALVFLIDDMRAVKRINLKSKLEKIKAGKVIE